MGAGRKQIRIGSRAAANRRRRTPTFSEALKLADARARARVTKNRPAGRRRFKHVQAAIATPADFDDTPGILVRMFRWMLAAAVLPVCAITTWTFLNQFRGVALDRAFWSTSAFWYFATGALLMTGWFVSGLLWNAFLYLYVLGHELTHILAIWMFRGKVSNWGVGTEGGFVTTDKSNIVISLAPYFVPLWAVLVMVVFLVAGWIGPLSPPALKTLYGLLGFFWAFHLLWTLWMIPRDQPDLRDNGTFLSLTIIYLANLLIVIALTSAASPEMSLRGFAHDWLANAREAASGTRVIVRDWVR